MSKAEIIGITVSVEFGFEGEYGKGTKSFANVQARYPEPNGLENLPDVLVDGVDMYLTAWRTLLSARYATGVLTSSEYNSAIETTNRRVQKVLSYLKEESSEDAR